MSDLIDREAALNCFHSWVDKYGDVYTPDDMPEYQAIRASTSKYTGFMEMEMYTDDDAVEAIEGLPSAQSYTDEEIQKMQDIEQAQLDKAYEMGKADAMRWIPCGERLPDRFGEMLVTFIPAAGTLWTRVIIAHYSDLMGIAKPCFWIGNVGKSDFANITSQVVAWMPLPEPYKEDDHETD